MTTPNVLDLLREAAVINGEGYPYNPERILAGVAEIERLRTALRYLLVYGMGEDEHPYHVARKALGDE